MNPTSPMSTPMQNPIIPPNPNIPPRVMSPEAVEPEAILATSLFPSTETIGTLVDKISEFLGNTEIQQNPELVLLLKTKSRVLFSINAENPLDPENLAFYQKITKLMDDTGKIAPLVAKQLVIDGSPRLVIGGSPQPPQHQSTLVQALPSPIIFQKVPLPAIAFGAEKWNKYFGDVGEEPPLPPDIGNILRSPCPFWPGNKVYDTHLLFLVPATVNGENLTLNLIQELIQAPKEGYKTQFSWYSPTVKNELGNQSTFSCWCLMTRGVIPYSRHISHKGQKNLVETYAQKSSLPYKLPEVLDATIGPLVEYVETGRRLYSDNPLTYGRCLEKVDNYQWPVAISFGSGGLGIYFSYLGNDDFNGVGACVKFSFL